MIPIWIADLLSGLLIGLVAFFIFLHTPLVEILNLVLMPFGYRISSCPNCLDVGLQKRQYGTCVVCGERFSYYGYSTTSVREYNDRHLRLRFCGHECRCYWEEAGEPLNLAIRKHAEVVPS